jgi:hypothetical protein
VTPLPPLPGRMPFRLAVAGQCQCCGDLLHSLLVDALLHFHECSTLEIQRNAIEGEIPASISECRHLE